MVTAASITLTNILSKSPKSRSEVTFKDHLHDAGDTEALSHCPRHLKGSFLQLGPDLSHMVLIKNYRIKILSVCIVKARSIPREI